jgi:hypothetical protein
MMVRQKDQLKINNNINNIPMGEGWTPNLDNESD